MKLDNTFATTFLFSRAGFASLALFATSIAAQALVIDNFENPQAVLTRTQTTDLTPISNSGTPQPGSVFTSRVMTLTPVDRDGGNNFTATMSIDSANSGELLFATDPNIRATGLVVYDAPSNINLTSDGSDAFRLTLSFLDLPSNFNFSVLTSGGLRTATVNVATPVTGGLDGTGPLTVDIPYSAFSGSGSFASVDTVSLELDPDSRGTDITVANLATVDLVASVPEPTTALAGVALCGMACLKRRRVQRA